MHLISTVQAWIQSNKPSQDSEVATSDLRLANVRSNSVIFECGHYHPFLFDVNFFGQIHHRKQSQVRARPHCGPCTMRLIRQYFRRCSCCGFVIMPDELVSLSPTAVDPYCREPWDSRVIVDGESIGYLACMRFECNGAHRRMAGYWRKEGFQPVDRDASGMIDLGSLISASASAE